MFYLVLNPFLIDPVFLNKLHIYEMSPEVLARTTWNNLNIASLFIQPFQRNMGVGRLLVLKNFITLPGFNSVSTQILVNTFYYPTKPLQKDPGLQCYLIPHNI